MKREFSLESGGPKRLYITYQKNLADGQVFFDGQQVISFASKAEFLRGTTVKLPDSSILTVRYGSIEGLPLFKNMHIIRNGVPVPGSAADPVPKWAWIFIGLSAVIPIISLGGALPVLIGVGGITGILTVSRSRHWSTAIRVGASAGITVACWVALLVVAVAITAVRGGVSADGNGFTANNGGETRKFVPNPKLTDTDRRINHIGATYYKRGYMQSNIDKIKDNIADHCDIMTPSECSNYLDQEQAKADTAAIQPE